MFIVWRKRPIATDRPTDLFIAYSDQNVTDWEGNVLQSGRHRDCNSLDRPAWMQPPLRCEHKGPGRVAWTPLLMRAVRVDGKPRQKLLRRLHTLRSCCMKDAFTLAAWWHEIDSEVCFWRADYGSETARCFALDKAAVLHKLRAVAPRPSKAGVAAFTEFRLRKEAEKRQRFEESEARFRRHHEEQARRRAEQEGQAYEDLGALFRDCGKPH